MKRRPRVGYGRPLEGRTASGPWSPVPHFVLAFYMPACDGISEIGLENPPLKPKAGAGQRVWGAGGVWPGPARLCGARRLPPFTHLSSVPLAAVALAASPKLN